MMKRLFFVLTLLDNVEGKMLNVLVTMKDKFPCEK
jgi:hypothetical protein